jgi:bifunctional non-homologous end joining protein LigD
VRDLNLLDRLVFDLDPGEGVAWAEAIGTAVELRARLKDHGLESFVKTSGGKGLHIVVPVRPNLNWDDAKDFTRRLAEGMAKDAPQRFTARISKRGRTGRLFVDYLRNGRGATAVAAYSTRARSGAPGLDPPIVGGAHD